MAIMSKAEAAWVKRLQKVLDDCPSDRIGAFTVGDPTVTLYDRSRDAEIDACGDVDFCKAVDLLDAGMGTLTFPFKVHSTCG